MARVCVELDLLKERIEEITLEFDDTTQTQKILYERIPDYCTHCKHIGHSIEGCYMNGNATRPPQPDRRPTSRAGSVGFTLKGLSGNMDKSRGANDISKTRKANNPNLSQGANRAVAQNLEWIKVKNKKGPRETGLVSKEVLKLAHNSKHTYFEDCHSNADELGSNRFSILDNDVSQPLDTMSHIIKGPDHVQDAHLNDQIGPIIVKTDSIGNVAMDDNSCLEPGLDHGASNKIIADSAIKKGNLTVEKMIRHNKDKVEGGSNILYSKTHNLTEKRALIGLEKRAFIPSLVNGCPVYPTHTPPTLSCVENNTHTNDPRLMDFINIGPQILSDNLINIGQQCSSSLNLNRVEIEGDSIIHGSNFLMDSETGATKRDICNALSDNIPPDLSQPAPHLEDVIGQLYSNGNLGPMATTFHATKVVDDIHKLASDKHLINGNKALPTSPCAAPTLGVVPGNFLSSFSYSTNISTLAPPQNPSSAHAANTPRPCLHLGAICPLNGNSNGPTPMLLFGQKGDDSQHTFLVDNDLHSLQIGTNNLIGPPSFSSPCAALIKEVGQDVLLSPMHNSALNFKLAPPPHLPSAAVDTPSSDDGSRATLGQRYCLNEAQLFSCTPAQSSSAAIGSEPYSPTPPSLHQLQPNPSKLVAQAYSAESACTPHSAESVNPPHHVLQPAPVASIYVIKETGLNPSAPNYNEDQLISEANFFISDKGKIETKLHKDGNRAGDGQTGFALKKSNPMGS
ncbi:hypothetical protein DH2020_034118 [Rehmannia glutinosa]|uniref:Uncharacterized protein n=1 Tax=Rehmannia glutinosa TaxID=99300 RepID=A0ABR0VB65_REHGL